MGTRRQRKRRKPKGTSRRTIEADLQKANLSLDEVETEAQNRNGLRALVQVQVQVSNLYWISNLSLLVFLFKLKLYENVSLCIKSKNKF